MIQISIVSQIQLAMEELNVTKEDIAETFANRYGAKWIVEHITDLFTCDARMDLEDIALFQSALGIKFTFGYEVKEEA
jgi:hypothetical protein